MSAIFRSLSITKPTGAIPKPAHIIAMIHTILVKLSDKDSTHLKLFNFVMLHRIKESVSKMF